MKIKNYAFLGLYLTLFSQSFGVELTVEDVIERARLSNNQIKIQGLNTNIQEKNKDKAFKNLILPPINLSVEEEWDIVKDQGFGANEIEAVIPVFVGGKNINSYKKAKANFQIAEKEEILMTSAVEELVVSTFFQSLNYKKQIEITDKAIEAMGKQKERLSALFEGGKLVPKSELLKVEASIEKNKGIKLQNIKNEKLSMGRLSKMLNYPLDTTYDEMVFDIDDYLLTKKDIKDNLNKNIEMTALGTKEKLKVDVAEYNLNIAKADMYPVIYMKPSYTYKNKVGDKLVKRDVDDRYVFEVGFNWYFRWGGTVDNIKQQKWAYEKSLLEYEDNMKGITLEVENKYREIETYYGQSIAAEKEVALLKENMELDGMRYENELITTFDYLNSVNSYRTAQAEYFEIVRNLVLSIMTFENMYK